MSPRASTRSRNFGRNAGVGKCLPASHPCTVAAGTPAIRAADRIERWRSSRAWLMSWANSVRVGRYCTGLPWGCCRFGGDLADADMAAGTAKGKLRATAPFDCDHRHDRVPSYVRSVQRPPALMTVPAAPSEALLSGGTRAARVSSYRLVHFGNPPDTRAHAGTAIQIGHQRGQFSSSSPSGKPANRPNNAQLRHRGSPPSGHGARVLESRARQRRSASLPGFVAAARVTQCPQARAEGRRATCAPCRPLRTSLPRAGRSGARLPCA